MSSMIHRHTGQAGDVFGRGDGTPQVSHGDLLFRSTHSKGHPIYVQGEMDNQAEEHGTVAFAVGVTSVPVVFTSTFFLNLSTVVSIEKAGVVQAGGIDSVTLTGFNFKRSSGAGTATGHWHAIGTRY